MRILKHSEAPGHSAGALLNPLGRSRVCTKAEAQPKGRTASQDTKGIGESDSLRTPPDAVGFFLFAEAEPRLTLPLVCKHMKMNAVEDKKDPEQNYWHRPWPGSLGE